MKTYIPKEKDKSEWYVVDAKDKVLGRFACKVAALLRGKGKTTYTPHCDPGTGVIVINAGHIRVTGNKLTEKMYKSYSGYPSGLKEVTLEHLLTKKPERVIRHAVKGMLPKSRLGDRILKRLKVYAGPEHPHAAQQPKQVECKTE